MVFAHDTETALLTAAALVNTDSSTDGDTLRIAGRVNGPVTVANGTLHLLPGARVTGDILVVGGRLLRSDNAVHTGTERVFWDAAPVLRTDDGMLVLRERRRPLGEFATASTTFQTGKVRTTLLLATGGTYNRVEGLPIVFGPTFEYRASKTTSAKLDLRGILRTTSSNETRLQNDFGYRARLELRHGIVGVAGQLYSEVEAFEDQPLSPSENGWAAFLLQRDYRDYYERVGGGGALWVTPIPTLRVEGNLRYDNERSVRDADPWSLFRNSDQWRPNPLIDDGHYTTLGAQVDYDTRNERYLPSSGWLLRGRFEHSGSDDVAPVLLPESVRPELPIYVEIGRAADRRRLRLRQAAARLPAVFEAHPFPPGQRPPARRLVDRRRSSSGAAPGVARRHRHPARVRLPGLRLRPRGLLRPGPAGALRSLDERAGGGPDSPQSQPRVPAP